MKNLVSCRKEAAMRTDFPSFLLSQLIPARGRKPNSPCGMMYPGKGHNLSPRGDGNRCSGTEERDFRVTTYPREGTETDAFSFGDALKASQLIPARGRKPAIAPASCCFCSRHNLSPRGDGNLVLTGKKRDDIVTTYPREGTTAFSFATTVHLSVTTYPRKGTKKALSEKTERAFSCLYNSKKIRPPYLSGTAAYF